MGFCVLYEPKEEPMQIPQIDSLEEYFSTFGHFHSRKAAILLKPLHTPGEDPLPPFKGIMRQPFDPQAHVIAACVKMLDHQKRGFLIGEMGCIAGESWVMDPVAGCARQVETIDGPFHVWAWDWDAAEFVVAEAESPFIKGERDLFRVTLSNGQEFVCTDHHRILTVDGWLLVREVSIRLRSSEHALLLDMPDPERNTVHVRSIAYERSGPYWDFTVPKYGNYVMAGVVHHNTGKTIQGMLAVHEHAVRSRHKGGSNGKYRALILCPDHLIKKWRDEIEATIPGAGVTTFDNTNKGCKQLLKDVDRLWGEMHGQDGHWPEPAGPEWFILGRDQAKLGPTKRGACHIQKGEYRGKGHYDKTIHKTVYQPDLFLCPRCHQIVKDKNGAPINPLQLSKPVVCGSKFAVEQVEPGCRTAERRLLTGKGAEFPIGIIKEEQGKKWRVAGCGEQLWQYQAKPKRWPAGAMINKRFRKAFTYLIVDEMHEQNKKATAQSNAMGNLISGIPYCLGLTGTLIGGYARDIFSLMFRFNANALIDEGFGWGQELAFTRKYGRIETVVTTRTGPGGEVKVSKGRGKRMSMRSEEETTQQDRAAPGIMPALFGNHLIDKAVFIALQDMSEELPAMREYVGGPPAADYDADDRAMYQECAVPMDGIQGIEYKHCEDVLVSKCKEMLVKGNMKLLGGMLSCLLGYPDYPWDWEPPDEVANREEPAIGYWIDQKGGPWEGVLQPRTLDRDIIYPKEQALLDIIKREHAAGNQVWVYALMTDKRDVQVRLQYLIERELGLRVKVLRSKAVKPKERLAWIEKNGAKADVIISHPKLVCTGVDFFAKDKSFNFNAIVFYETGYSIFILRQSAARAWRLLQWRKCRVYYLHYAETMQAKALHLISRKMAAATQLDGELNVEGLTAISDEGESALALARSISESIDEKDILRHWSKIGKPSKPSALEELGLTSMKLQELDAIDNLPIQLAIAAETILDHDPRFSRDRLASLFDDFGLTEADMAMLEAF